MAITVDDIKLSLRIDVTEDDPMIQSYLDAARDYVQTAVRTCLESFQEYSQEG